MKSYSIKVKNSQMLLQALLMPQQMIDLDVRNNKLTYSFIVALARKYHVSTQAILWRLCYLRFIHLETVNQILADDDFVKLDRSTFDRTFKSSQPLGNRFHRLAYLAYEKGRLSKGRLAQMLGVKLRDVGQYLSKGALLYK